MQGPCTFRTVPRVRKNGPVRDWAPDDATRAPMRRCNTVDGDDVIERRLERRKEARALGFEIGLRKLVARRKQPMIRPRVVVRHRGEMMRQSGWHSRTYLKIGCAARLLWS